MIREVLAKLTTEERDGREQPVWVCEESVELLVDLRDRLSAGTFINQKEIADYYDKSRPMGRKYLERGIKLGLFSQDEVGRWFGKGRTLRDLKRTTAPIKPSRDWIDEAPDEEDAEPAQPTTEDL